MSTTTNKQKSIQIPALNLQAEFREIESELKPRILSILKSGRYILGKEVEAFETSFAKFVGTKYAIGLASGSDALLLGLMALGVKPGDEVITSPFSFIATATSIARLGAKPVFVDIDPITFNLNPSLIKNKVTSKTRGIIPVHLFGHACRMDQIMAIAKEHDLFVIEDAAQATGATFRKKQVGSFGEFGAFSFYPTKTIGAMGDAGAITTNDSNLYEAMKSLHIHGEASRKEPYRHVSIGINSRLDEIQAAVLNVKLKRLKKWNEARRKIAKRYDEGLRCVTPAKAGVQRPFLDSRFRGNDNKIQLPIYSEESVFHQYSIKTHRRDELLNYLRERGIQAGIYYPIPIHLQPCFEADYKKNDFPVTESVSKQVLSLPIYPQLTTAHQHRIIKTITKFF